MDGRALLPLLLTCLSFCGSSALGNTTSSSSPKSPIVQLSAARAQVQGLQLQAVPSGQVYFSFRGIPYARPPTSQLRFKAPQAALPWTGVREATTDAPCCPQMANGTMVGSEDCLYINVYTPSLSCRSAPRPGTGPRTPPRTLPVMVFVHGGDFLAGCASSSHLGPDLLVSQGVVVVTFNYRLGPLGFANLNTVNVPGNAGLKDMLLALRWVRDNVPAFCGDPARVTLVGHGTGAASVELLGLSKLSEGLFRAQIEMSGSALSFAHYTEDNVGRANVLATRLGARDASETEEVLLRAPVWDLVIATWDLYYTGDGWGLPLNPFVPSPEKAPSTARPAGSRPSAQQGLQQGGAEPKVLDKDPETLIGNPPVRRRPTLAGVVSREGLPAALALQAGPGAEAFRANFSRYLQESILRLGADSAARLYVEPRPNAKQVQRLQRLVQGHYFASPDQEVDVRKFPGDVVNLIGDVRTVAPVYFKASSLDKQPAPFFLYVYDAPPTSADDNGQRTLFNSVLSGVPHGSELRDVFVDSSADLKQKYSSGNAAGPPDLLARLFVDFTKEMNSSWLEDMSQNRKKPSYLYLSSSHEIKRDNVLLQEKRLDFWMDVLKNIRTPSL